MRYSNGAQFLVSFRRGHHEAIAFLTIFEDSNGCKMSVLESGRTIN